MVVTAFGVHVWVESLGREHLLIYKRPSKGL